MNKVQEVNSADGFHYRFEFVVESKDMLGVPFREVTCCMYVDQHFAVQFVADDVFIVPDGIEIHKGSRIIKLSSECDFLMMKWTLW